MSGTLNAARLAARSLPIPVRLVDSGTAGFGVSCCVWAAAEAIARGANARQAVQVADSLSPHIGTVFMSARRCRRLHAAFQAGSTSADGIPLMTLHDGQLKVAGHGSTTSADGGRDDGADGDRLGTRSSTWPSAWPISGRAADGCARGSRRSHSPNVVEVVRYRIGPSVGVYSRARRLSAASCSLRVTGSPRARTAQSSSQLKKL